jgi:hypothetical protein
MGVGPTLLGGIVGAAVGVGLHTLLETGMLGKPIEASWFAIVIGLLTGLGVRQANRTHMERSYLRGALSGLIALAAIYGSTVVIAEVAKRRDKAMVAKPVAAAGEADEASEEAADGDEAAVAEAETPTADADRTMNPALAGGVVGNPRAGDLNPWQFVFMALGALVAYEFGRGAGAPKPAAPADATPPEGMGRATDPSE